MSPVAPNRYWASGDTARFLKLAPDVGRIIDHTIQTFLQPRLEVAFFGWDDRIANGFCGSCNLEVQLGFAALVIRACGDFAATLAHAGDHVNASKYNATATKLAAQLRSRPSRGGGAWHDDYGVHAAAYAINAKVLATSDEVETLVNRELSNAVTVCSWSPFNNYWILQVQSTSLLTAYHVLTTRSTGSCRALATLVGWTKPRLSSSSVGDQCSSLAKGKSLLIAR
jgi:hypothetical protein